MIEGIAIVAYLVWLLSAVAVAGFAAFLLIVYAARAVRAGWRWAVDALGARG